MKHSLNIFNYTSYREFLRDLYNTKKTESEGFSHRVFVRTCGFSSPNFLKLVIEGKRDLGKKAQAKLIDALCSNRPEREYLQAVMDLEHSSSAEEKNWHMSIISRLRHRKNVKTVDVDQYEYLSKWHNVAIREMVALDDFKEDATYINSRLHTSLSEQSIRSTIEMLISLKLLKRDENGRLVQTDPKIICEPRIFSVAVNNYHREMLQKASESIEKGESSDRDITGLTVSLDREAFEKIVKVIKECREEIHSIASRSRSHDAVYQIALQVFNLTEAIWKTKE